MLTVTNSFCVFTAGFTVGVVVPVDTWGSGTEGAGVLSYKKWQ